MKKIAFIIAGILLITGFHACKKLPVYQAEYIESEAEIFNKQDDAPPFTHYDPESRIRYDVFHNDSMVFLYFDVSDQVSIRKIFALGLEIYVDKEGKRNRNQGFIYPVSGAVKQGAVLKPQDGLNPAIPDKSLITELQKNISPEYILIQDDEEESFNLFAHHNNLRISMDLSEDGNLSYKAEIPVKMFGMDSIPDQLTIGLLTGEMPENENMDEQTPNNQNVNMQNPAYNNPMSPHQPVSGNMPGNRNMQNSNQRPYNRMAEPIRIWFIAKPEKPRTFSE
jgi:hypothetical protein